MTYTKEKWEVTETLSRIAITIPHNNIGISFDTICNINKSIRKGSPEANAHRIVQCVNGFDELVGALEQLIRSYPSGTSYKTVENARQALKSAEGESK